MPKHNVRSTVANAKAPHDKPGSIDREAAATARRLARELLAIADALESGERPELAPRRRRFVRVMVGARYDLDDPRQNVEDNKQRDHVLDTLRLMGESIREVDAKRPEHLNPRLVGGVAQVAVTMLCEDMPEYASRLRAQLPLITAIIETHRTNLGGRGRRVVEGRPVLIEKLCEAMGWSGSTTAIRQARARRRRKPVTD